MFMFHRWNVETPKESFKFYWIMPNLPLYNTPSTKIIFSAVLAPHFGLVMRNWRIEVDLGDRWHYLYIFLVPGCKRSFFATKTLFVLQPVSLHLMFDYIFYFATSCIGFKKWCWRIRRRWDRGNEKYCQDKRRAQRRFGSQEEGQKSWLICKLFE